MLAALAAWGSSGRGGATGLVEAPTGPCGCLAGETGWGAAALAPMAGSRIRGLGPWGCCCPSSAGAGRTVASAGGLTDREALVVGEGSWCRGGAAAWLPSCALGSSSWLTSGPGSTGCGDGGGVSTPCAGSTGDAGPSGSPRRAAGRVEEEKAARPQGWPWPGPRAAGRRWLAAARRWAEGRGAPGHPKVPPLGKGSREGVHPVIACNRNTK